MAKLNLNSRALTAAILIVGVTGCGGAEDEGNEGQEDAAEDGGSEGDEQQPTYTYWRDAKAVLDDKCVGCHVDGDIAPFPLGSYSEVAAVAAILPGAIEAGTMPPWLAGEGCHEYRHDRSLAETERELLLTWLEEGAPEGDPADEPPPSEEPASEFHADLTLTLPEPYIPTKEPDDYRCFVIPWDGPEPYVTGFHVVPDQRSIVHHVIVFASEPEQAEQVEALDAAEDGPGYTCYGGAGIGQARWVGSWAPGGRATIYPEGTGVRVDPGSRLIIQVHYNTSSSQPVADASSIELSLADNVERPLLNQPLTNPNWVFGAEPMTIPAGDPEVTHSTELDLGGALWSAQLAELGLAEGEDMLLHTAGLHMHQLGVRARLSIIRAGSDEECVLDIPAWDFNWQGGYDLIEPIRIHPGDKIGLECTWDNSPSNQPIIDGQLAEPIDVEWGEGTRDEMCLGIASLSRP